MVFLLIDEAWILGLSLRSITNRRLRRALFWGIGFRFAFSLLFTFRGFVDYGRLDNVNLKGFTRTK